MSYDEILNKFSSTQTNQSQNVTPAVTEPGQSVDQILEGFNKSTNTDDNTADDNSQSDDTTTDNQSVNTTEDLKEEDFKAIDLLIKEGKLMPMEDESGQLIPIKTKADLIDLIDRNNEYFQQNSYEVAQKQFYETKSPVWQTLLQYAETARDINDIAPLFNAIQNYQASTTYDLENEFHQEEMIRVYGQMKGLDPKTIEEDIDDLKDRNKLKDRATQLKPSIEKYNEQRVNSILAQKQQEEQATAQVLQKHYNNVVENIIKPAEVGGFKLTNEHKQMVASTLVPDPKIGGLPIFTIINNLVEEGKFDILTKISLMALDPTNFDNYYSSKVSNKVASDLQRRLRTATSQQNSNGSISETDNNQMKPNTKIDNKSTFYFGK